MRISDWSSDVCSSDLGLGGVVRTLPAPFVLVHHRLEQRAENRRTDLAPIELRRRDQIVAHLGIEHRGAQVPLEQGAIHIGKFVELRVEARDAIRSEEHTSELQSLMRISYAVFCLKKKKQNTNIQTTSKSTKLTH